MKQFRREEIKLELVSRHLEERVRMVVSIKINNLSIYNYILFFLLLPIVIFLSGTS